MCASMTPLMANCPEDISQFLIVQLDGAKQFQIHTRYLDALLTLTSLVLTATSDAQVHVGVQFCQFYRCVTTWFPELVGFNGLRLILSDGDHGSYAVVHWGPVQAALP